MGLCVRPVAPQRAEVGLGAAAARGRLLEARAEGRVQRRKIIMRQRGEDKGDHHD